MKFFYLQVFLLSIFLYSCHYSQSNGEFNKIVSSQLINLPSDTLCTLQENLFVLGGVPSDIDFIDDSLLLAMGSRLVLYNNIGMQVKEFGQYGSGPGEYIRPAKLYVSSKNVYVWCEQSLKLIIYDLKGNFIREHKYIQHAIKNFTIWKDKYVCFLIYGEVNHKRVEIYDIESEKHIRTINQKDDTDDILAIAKFSGGIFIMNDSLYWCNPSSTKIYYVSLDNIKNDTIRIIGFTDTDFLVDKKETPLKNNMNKNPNIIFDYIRNNSRIIQAFSKNDTILLLAETGKSEYQDRIINHKKRKIKYYILVNNGETIKSFTFDYPPNYGLIKGLNKSLTILTGESREDSLIMNLYRLDI